MQGYALYSHELYVDDQYVNISKEKDITRTIAFPEVEIVEASL